MTISDSCTTTTTVVKRTVYTDPSTGVQTQTAYSSTTTYATSASNLQGTTTTSAAGPGLYETTTTTTTKNTDLSVTASWSASATRGVNGYLVNAHLADGTVTRWPTTSAGTLSTSSTVDADGLVYQPRLSVTTLTSYGWTARSALTGVHHVLTALVVDDDPDARRRVAGLLRLGGWQVSEATCAEDAMRASVVADFDLVVTDVSMPGENGPAMLHRMRRNGSHGPLPGGHLRPHGRRPRRARVAAGAMACLAKPVEAGILLDFLRSRTTGPAAQGEPRADHEVDDLQDEDLDAELMDRLQEMYVSALPARLSAIARSTTSGDAPGVVSAAHTLAGTSGQLGHPEVASICRAIAADARRGVMAHARVVELQALALAG